jgi:hypothetical protein
MVDNRGDEDYRIDEPPPPIPGGTYRPSQRVDLQGFDAIRRRQELNRLLRTRTCDDAEPIAQELRPGDLDLLLQIARERDPNANPAIRERAIETLAEFRNLEAAELLAEIASSAIEHEAVRSQALLSMARTAPRLATGMLQQRLGDSSPLVREAAVIALAEIGGVASLGILTDQLERERDSGVRQRAAQAIQALGGQPRGRARTDGTGRRPRKPQIPDSED